jgi:hypothetical protein
MDKILKAYLDNAAEIIGHRSPSEKAYDDAVVDALRQGKTIKESLAIAGTQFPDEAPIKRPLSREKIFPVARAW